MPPTFVLYCLAKVRFPFDKFLVTTSYSAYYSYLALTF